MASNSLHIVLDLQACQSPESRRRGIGRYSLALAKAMAEQPRGHDITVLLNEAMGESIEFLRAQFDGLLPQERLHTWQALAPTAFIQPGNAFRMRASEILRTRALRRLKPDIVHVASLFEGLADDVIATVSGNEAHQEAVTLYDLIPLAHEETYLGDAQIRRWYMEKVQHLRRADVLLGISRFSCDEASELLGIDADRLTDISGAADDIFMRLDGIERYRDELMHRYGLRKPFVMYAGGFDARKNIDALVRAFALLPYALRRAHQLVIVGGAPAPERKALDRVTMEAGLGADEVVFTGYVPDGDLVKLYNLCALYVFPSLQEGFGLPALEAMSSGAIVIGSNTSSLPEVIGNSDALFNPRDDHAIASKMVSALTDEAFRASLREHGRHQCRKFSWAESARRALAAFEAAADRRMPSDSVVVPVSPRSSTAWLPAPLSPATQGQFGSVATYADADCTGTTAEHSLARFTQDRDRFERVAIELSNDRYCAKTLGFAATGPVDIVLREPTFGVPLQVLAQSPEGRGTVVSLLYGAGGYPALRTAIEDDFSSEVLGRLVTPDSLTMLGRSQVVSDGLSSNGAGHEGLAWRDDIRGAIDQLVDVEGAAAASEQDWANVATALSSTLAAAPDPASQWLVDISNLFVNDAGTGIQRVVRHVLDELLAAPPPGYRVEPVCLGDDGVFRYARSYCRKRYFEGERLPPDEPVEFASGDVYLGLDLVAHLIPAYIDVFRTMRNRGVQQHFVLYDLLPILRPDCFSPHLLALGGWYEAVSEVADGVICISQAVADEFEAWLHQARPARQRPLAIGWFHLGADLAKPGTAGAGDQPIAEGLAELGDHPTFLMVGTIEPRKGHAQTLAAFDQLWEQGLAANLLVVGKPGWLVDDLLQRLREHPLRGKRLFWFENAGDDLLLAAYSRASALLMASEGEGFGLPLIEAAHHGLPLIARDLPVFREIAGQHAHYFTGYDAGGLARALRTWLELDARGQAPQSGGVQWQTWKEATAQLVDVVRREDWVHRWMPGPTRRYGAFDHRFQTQVGHLTRGRMITGGRAGLLLYGPYVPMGAGHYKVRIHGGGAGAAWMDVCSSHGAIVHSHMVFAPHASDTGAMLVEVGLRLDCDVSDLEVRVGVDADTDMWVGGVEIHPVALANPLPPQPELQL